LGVDARGFGWSFDTAAADHRTQVMKLRKFALHGISLDLRRKYSIVLVNPCARSRVSPDTVREY
jgi:hypothetical protein